MDSTSSPWWSNASWWPQSSSTPDGVDTWAAAVDLGARGHGAAARAALDALARETTDPRTASLAHSTRASLIRQAGGHGTALIDDGLACRLVAGAARDEGDEWAFAAWIDGLVGLAADGLGVGDFGASRALLARAGSLLADREGRAGEVRAGEWITDGRVRLRHAWVQTEFALFSGDTPGAVEPRERALRLAADAPSPRHVVKTDLIAAAVAAANGELRTAASIASDCENACTTWGLLPLQWAAVTMLSGIGPDPAAAARRAADSADRLAARGMPVTPAA
ncbi:hypothetical protein L5G28_16070 [Gordonia sp. HY285]|uniref:hypothetical protein n=1 Tax=Gordonia liuliyuniae TaxID=2911517 RepID=UPI001F45F1C0|nr:hypothetical protein [Gordonia liuliyuniae]MCF8611663.1 hypothetical protein [Gordonia liuliyuniae]